MSHLSSVGEPDPLRYRASAAGLNSRHVQLQMQAEQHLQRTRRIEGTICTVDNDWADFDLTDSLATQVRPSRRIQSRTWRHSVRQSLNYNPFWKLPGTVSSCYN
jgi:hypothetical protein